MVVDKLTLNGKRDVWATRYMAPYSQELVSCLAFLTVFAVAVFGFGVPVYAGHSERLMSREEVVGLFLFMVPGFALFAAMGWLLLSRMKPNP